MTGTIHQAPRQHANTTISSREAALVGALTAFVRSPPTDIDNASFTPGQSRRRRSTASLGPTARYSELRSNKSLTRPTVKQKPRSLRPANGQAFRAGQLPSTPYSSHTADNSVSIGRHNDDHLPSTSSLVHLFEQRENENSATRPLGSSGITGTRPQKQSIETEQTYLEDDTREDSALSADGVAGSKHMDKDDTLRRVSSPDSFFSARETPSQVMSMDTITAQKPSLPPPQRKGALKSPVYATRQPSQSLPLQNSGKVQATTQPIAIRPQLQPAILIAPDDSSSPSPSITATYHQLHPRRKSVLNTGDSLADAIVASSLASSRAPSPTRHERPATLRPSRSHSIFGRTPSPSKKPLGMRQTLRKDSSSSSSESDGDPYSKHKKKRHIRKHPNKHAEGDRKRWRDAVTERERKRYEGVWAANKGFLVTYTSEEQEVLAASAPDSTSSAEIRESAASAISAAVARDLWTRSRLPGHVLEEIWDLVDGNKIGRLIREEFVVGLWLIDQRLKGRKLPTKVSDSVWNSVRFLQGIKIRKK